MNTPDSTALRVAVEDAIRLFRGNRAQFRTALSPVIETLEALCASLQHSLAKAGATETHAAVLVVSRDLVAGALRELSARRELDNPALLLGLAGLHRRIVIALDACTIPRP